MTDACEGGVPDLLARLRELGDGDLLELIRAAVADRPALAALHASAVSLTVPGGGSDVPPPTTLSARVPGVAHAAQADYTEAGVPTYEGVRHRIEERAGTSLGAAELAEETAAGRELEDRWEARRKAGHAKLDEIRRSMGRE